MAGSSTFRLRICSGVALGHQRRQRSPGQVRSDWLRGVKGAGRLAQTRPRLQRTVGPRVLRPVFARDCGRFDRRLRARSRAGFRRLRPAVRHRDRGRRCVRVRRDRGRASRQRENRRSRRFVVQVAALGKRRSGGREQPSVERGDVQISGTAAGVREVADGAQRVPQTRRTIASRSAASRIAARL